MKKNGNLQALCSLLVASGLLGACFQPADGTGAGAGTAARAIDADGVYEVAVWNDSEAYFWDFSNLNGVMSTAPGVFAWSSRRIGTALMNASGLAQFDVLVIPGFERGFVTAQAQADIRAWVMAGGVLIIAAGSMAEGHDRLLGGFGSAYHFDWIMGYYWCQNLPPADVDPTHPLLTTPNALGSITPFYNCHIASVDDATLGSAWRVAARSSDGNVIMASATAGRGGIVISGINPASLNPGLGGPFYPRLAENLITQAFCTGDDSDGDGWVDECDNCPAVPNGNQADGNDDGAGDACQPSIDVLAVAPYGGPRLLGIIDVAAPDGDPLNGEMEILTSHGDPIAITMEMLATCGNDTVELALNGTNIASMIVGPYCTCSQAVDVTVNSDAATLAALFDEGRENTLTARKYSYYGYYSTLAWVAATLEYGDGTTQRVCVRGNCDEPDFCEAEGRGAPFETSVNVPRTTALSVSYQDSALPAFLDTSGLAPGSYVLRATTTNGSSPVVADSEFFTLAGESRLVITPPVELPCNEAALCAPTHECEDSDSDGIFDVCDNCPAVANDDQADGNGDGAGDACQPTIDVVSVGTTGANLLGIIDIADPDGDPLSGEVQILGSAGDPVAITMEMLATCAGDSVELALNGTPITSMLVGDHCTCYPPGVDVAVVSDAGGLAVLFDENGENTLSVRKDGYYSALAWVAATLEYGDGTTQRICVRGNCEERQDLCLAGYEFGYIHDSVSLPTTRTTLLSVSYESSTLPAFLDTSGLAPGSYVLRATTTDGSSPIVVDSEPFALTGGESRLLINNQAPAALCSDAAVCAPAGQCVASASIDAGSFDPNGDTISLAQSPAGPYALGSTAVTLSVSDDLATSQCSATVQVDDCEAPTVAIGASPTLWPPQRAYHRIGLADCDVLVADTCDGALFLEGAQITCVSSDEPDDGNGNTRDDIVIVDEQHVDLRAERAGNGNGRVYRIGFQVHDAAGNVTDGVCLVGVPRSQGGGSAVADAPVHTICR